MYSLAVNQSRRQMGIFSYEFSSDVVHSPRKVIKGYNNGIFQISNLENRYDHTSNVHLPSSLQLMIIFIAKAKC